MTQEYCHLNDHICNIANNMTDFISAFKQFMESMFEHTKHSVTNARNMSSLGKTILPPSTAFIIQKGLKKT